MKNSILVINSGAGGGGQNRIKKHKSAIERRSIILFNSASCSHDNNDTLSVATKRAGKDPQRAFGRKYIHRPHPKSFPLASDSYLIFRASIANIKFSLCGHFISMVYLYHIFQGLSIIFSMIFTMSGSMPSRRQIFRASRGQSCLPSTRYRP